MRPVWSKSLLSQSVGVPSHRSGSAAQRQGSAAAGSGDSGTQGTGSRGGMQNSGMRPGVSTLEKAGSGAEERSRPRKRILLVWGSARRTEACLQHRKTVEFGLLESSGSLPRSSEILDPSSSNSHTSRVLDQHEPLAHPHAHPAFQLSKLNTQIYRNQTFSSSVSLGLIARAQRMTCRSQLGLAPPSALQLGQWRASFIP